MNRLVMGGDLACQEIAQALGFDPQKIRGLVLSMRAGECVTATVEYYVDSGQIETISSVVNERAAKASVEPTANTPLSVGGTGRPIAATAEIASTTSEPLDQDALRSSTV